MTITIKIDTGNAAFEDGNKDTEVARIVSKAVANLDCMSPGVKHALYDINGNNVGSVVIRGK